MWDAPLAAIIAIIVSLREQQGIAARARIRHSHSRQDKRSSRRAVKRNRGRCLDGAERAEAISRRVASACGPPPIALEAFEINASTVHLQ